MNAFRIVPAIKLLAMAVTACAIVGCVFQPPLESPTRADRPIETIAAKETASEPTTSVLVQGSNVSSVAAAVRAVGGEVTHELGIINAVGAQLTQDQIRRLETSDDTLRIRANRTTTVSGAKEERVRKRRESNAKSGRPRVAADIEGKMHFRGRANQDADGNYYLEGLDGFMWSDGLTETMSINTWVGQQ